jgi:rod shape-determining protein MreD
VRAAAFIALATLAALVLQSTVLPLLPLGPVLPDLLLVVCVYLGLNVHSPGGAIGAFVIGFVQDSVSGTIPGLNAFAMSLVFLTVYFASRRLWVTNTFSQVILVFVASLVKTAAVVALIALFLSVDGLWHTVAKYIFIEAALAAVLSPPIFAVLARSRYQVAEE